MALYRLSCKRLKKQNALSFRCTKILSIVHTNIYVCVCFAHEFVGSRVYTSITSRNIGLENLNIVVVLRNVFDKREQDVIIYEADLSRFDIAPESLNKSCVLNDKSSFCDGD